MEKRLCYSECYSTSDQDYRLNLILVSVSYLTHYLINASPSRDTHWWVFSCLMSNSLTRHICNAVAPSLLQSAADCCWLSSSDTDCIVQISQITRLLFTELLQSRWFVEMRWIIEPFGDNKHYSRGECHVGPDTKWNEWPRPGQTQSLQQNDPAPGTQLPVSECHSSSGPSFVQPLQKSENKTPRTQDIKDIRSAGTAGHYKWIFNVDFFYLKGQSTSRKAIHLPLMDVKVCKFWDSET